MFLNIVDILAVIGLFALRIGVPLAIMVGLAYFLKRLDRRWEAEARAQQAAERPIVEPARQPAAQPAVAKAAAVPIGVDMPGVPRPQQPGLVNTGAQACYEVKGCTETMKAKCAAVGHPDMACWQARLQAEGHIPDTCPTCEIFQRFPM